MDDLEWEFSKWATVHITAIEGVLELSRVFGQNCTACQVWTYCMYLWYACSSWHVSICSGLLHTVQYCDYYYVQYLSVTAQLHQLFHPNSTPSPTQAQFQRVEPQPIKHKPRRSSRLSWDAHPYLTGYCFFAYVSTIPSRPTPLLRQLKCTLGFSSLKPTLMIGSKKGCGMFLFNHFSNLHILIHFKSCWLDQFYHRFIEHFSSVHGSDYISFWLSCRWLSNSWIISSVHSVHIVSTSHRSGSSKTLPFISPFFIVSSRDTHHLDHLPFQYYRLCEAAKPFESRGLYLAQIDCIAQGDLCVKIGVDFYPQMKLFENGVFVESYSQSNHLQPLSFYFAGQVTPDFTVTLMLKLTHLPLLQSSPTWPRGGPDGGRYQAVFGPEVHRLPRQPNL